MDNPLFAPVPVEDERDPAPEPESGPNRLFVGATFALLFEAIAFVAGALIVHLVRWIFLIRWIFW